MRCKSLFHFIVLPLLVFTTKLNVVSDGCSLFRQLEFKDGKTKKDIKVLKTAFNRAETFQLSRIMECNHVS